MSNKIKLSSTEIESDYTKEELKIVSNFIAEFFFGMLKPLRPEHIIIYAEKNMGIDPRRYIYSIPDEFRIKIRNVLHKNPHLIELWLTPEKFLLKCQERREDLFKCLSQSKYRKWFNKQVWVIKQAIKKI